MAAVVGKALRRVGRCGSLLGVLHHCGGVACDEALQALRHMPHAVVVHGRLQPPHLDCFMPRDPQSMPDQQVSVSGAEGFPLPGTRP